VTIPGRGDLSPPRRRHHPLRWLAVLVVLAVLAGAGYAGFRHFHASSPSRPAAAARLPVCHASGGNALFAAPGQVRLRIRNGSLQTGLAAKVRSELRRRGFHVGSIGNALTVGHDVAVVRYPPAQLRAARSVAAQVSGAVALQPAPGAGLVELDLGLRFGGLQSVAAARSAERRLLAGASPSPTASPTPTAGPTCQAS
jgi:hypothetical protein